VLDANLDHNHVTMLHTNGNSRAIMWLLNCIIILKRDALRSSFPTSRIVEIFIQVMFGSWSFEQDLLLIWLTSVLKMFASQEDGANIESMYDFCCVHEF
jgi:hypothetical protein